MSNATSPSAPSSGLGVFLPPSTDTAITVGGVSPIDLKADVVSDGVKPPPNSISAMHCPLPVTDVGNAYSLATLLGRKESETAAAGRITSRGCAAGRESSATTGSTMECHSVGTVI